MDLNKKSVKQQGGQMIPQQPGMQQQPKVDPAIQQISMFFKESIDQGGKPEEVVMGLIEQEVDQNTIVQALMAIGYQEKDLELLFQNIQQQQQPADPTPQQINQDPQQLARQQDIQEGQEGLDINIDPVEMAKSGIEIKPENKGKFTAWAKARGMSVQEAARKVMSNKDRYPPSIVKMANFAKNAAKFKKQEGGGTGYTEGVRQREGSYNAPNRKYTLDPRFKQQGGSSPAVNQFGNTDAEQNIINQNNASKEQQFPTQYQNWRNAQNLKREWENKDNNMFSDNIYPRQSEVDSLKQVYKNLPLINPSKNDKPLFPPELEELQFKAGGAFEPRFMYKGKRKIRAKDIETQLRLEEAGYTDKAETGQEILDLANQFANKGNTVIKNNKGDVINKEEVKVDNGDVTNPFYVSPNMFHSGKRWSFGEAVGLAGELFTGIQSAPDTLAADAAANQANKYANSVYNINVDDSEENVKAVNDYLTQYNIENPNGGNLPNLKDKVQINQNDINSKLNKGKDWLKENLSKLGTSAQSTYDAIINTPGFSSIPMAQNGGQPLTFKEWVMQDTVRRTGANAPQEYEAYVNTFSVLETGEDEDQESADSLFGNINFPSIDIDSGGILGGISRFPDTAFAKAAKRGSSFAVRAVSNVNDYLEDEIDDDREINFLNNLNADNTYATSTDPLFKRGKGPDINSGLYPEADKVTGYTQLSKYGGGTNNAGFKALPPEAQANILQNMQRGGVPGQQIPGMPTKAQLDAITGANEIEFVPMTPQYEFLTSLAEQSVDFQLPNFKKDSSYDKMLVTRLFNNSQLMQLPSQSENFELDNFQKRMQMGGNPFNPLKLFTGDLEEYQVKGETPLNNRRTKAMIEAEIAATQGQLTTEQERLLSYQSNIDKIYRGLITSKEGENDEEIQKQLTEILGDDSTIKRSIFDVSVDEYGDKVSGLDTVPSVTRNWLKSGTTAGYGCTSYGCGIMRSAGATTADGKPIPIISGNSQLNGMIENNRGGLQMQLMDAGYSDLQPGDRIVSNYSTSGGEGNAHTMIFTGDYDESGSPIMMENSGGRVDGGVNYRSLNAIKGIQDTSDPNSGLRVTRYVGSTNNLNDKLAGLQSELDSGKFFIPPESISTLEPMGIEPLEMSLKDNLSKLKMLPKNEYGGERGEAAYLANRNKVIQRELSKAQGGIPGSSNLATVLGSGMMANPMMQKLLNLSPGSEEEIINIYNEAQNIGSISEGIDFFSNVKKRDIKKYLEESGINKEEVRDYVYEQPFYDDASGITKFGIRQAMKLKGLKKGGETVNVDPKMLAKLIAAGADIEML